MTEKRKYRNFLDALNQGRYDKALYSSDFIKRYLGPEKGDNTVRSRVKALWPHMDSMPILQRKALIGVMVERKIRVMEYVHFPIRFRGIKISEFCDLYHLNYLLTNVTKAKVGYEIRKKGLVYSFSKAQICQYKERRNQLLSV